MISDRKKGSEDVETIAYFQKYSKWSSFVTASLVLFKCNISEDAKSGNKKHLVE